MMKNYYSILALLIFAGLFLAHSPAKKKAVSLTATVRNCGGQIGLYKFDGIGFVLLEQTKESDKDKYVFELKGADEPAILYLGKKAAQKLPVIIGPEKEIVLTSDCTSIRNAVFSKSDFNNQYNDVIRQIREQKGNRNTLMRQVQRSMKFPEMMKEAIIAIQEYEVEKGIYIDSMMGVNPFLGKLAAINGYQSYLANKKGHPDEIAHYGMEFFAETPLEDPAYDELAFLFEAFREYTTTLTKMQLDKEAIKKFANHTLQRIDSDRPAYKNALGGIVLALQTANHPAYLDFGHLFLDKYKSEKTDHVLALEKSLKNAKALLAGGEAPELTGSSPSGESLSLSELKGKYVLIDFWASWCGPCRKENPHVVELYKKYHEKGFDIFGVSLDRDKARWEKAINDDGLVWNHISDLKGWQSAHAATYGVRSIPTTVLLDKEGKIIARNLRSPQLAQELKKLFPE